MGFPAALTVSTKNIEWVDKLGNAMGVRIGGVRPYLYSCLVAVRRSTAVQLLSITCSTTTCMAAEVVTTQLYPGLLLE
jgi:hypothetical protein